MKIVTTILNLNYLFWRKKISSAADQGPYYKAYLRQKEATKQVEDLLESKSKELYLSNQKLQKKYHDLRKAKDELEKLHEDLKDSQLIMIQTEKMVSIGQLTGGIAHEINTPIQFVGDNLRFFKDECRNLFKHSKSCRKLIESLNDFEVLNKLNELEISSDLIFLFEEIPTAIDQSLEGINRVAELVRSMKEFSHPGDEKLKFIDINRSIQNVVNISKNEWKYVADVKLQLDETLPQIPCLHGEFNQVLLNIVVNAAHAIEDKNKGSNAKGVITLATKVFEKNLEIRIDDTGTGIPKEIRDKIFDPFFTTKEVGKGTGQGLAIAYKLISEKLNGSIKVESEIGQGTTFVISLPIYGECEGDIE